jgi:hypothetical protein
VFNKSFELGHKTKQRVLVFDMDETLVSARFEGRCPENFYENFSFEFNGSRIKVKVRPYL